MNGIIMMHGLPGTGKSFLAEEIALRIPNATVFKTVNFRENLQDSCAASFDETDSGTREQKDATYRQLIASARAGLEEGKLPVLDATFHKQYRREWAYELAHTAKTKLAIISTWCEKGVVFERLKKRESDPSEDAFLKSAEAFEMMNKQVDPLCEQNWPVKLICSSKNVDVEDLIGWLRTILS